MEESVIDLSSLIIDDNTLYKATAYDIKMFKWVNLNSIADIETSAYKNYRIYKNGKLILTCYKPISEEN